jgi:hypothetical protein
MSRLSKYMKAAPKTARITLIAVISVLIGVLLGPSLTPVAAGAHDAQPVRIAAHPQAP